MKPHIYLQAMGALSAMGEDALHMRQALFATQYPQTLQRTAQYSPDQPLPLGMLPASVTLPDLGFAQSRFQSRNNALAWAAACQIRAEIDNALAKFGPQRVGLVLGTSTSGVQEGEVAAAQLLQGDGFPAHFDYALQEMGNVAQFLATQLGIQGPAHVISTACSSGAKALASGARWLQAGIVDAVIVGGVDALCSFTVAGFRSLDSVSSQRCNPLSRQRDGINLGEAASLFLLGRDAGPVRLAGWGESQDAHHMSAPDPSGAGAIQAIQLSLERAGIAAAEIDYVNLHGTATAHNDAMEALAVHSVCGAQTPVSSTKPVTGHTLAAAGAMEAAIAWHVLVDNPSGRLPVHWWDGATDDNLMPLNTVAPGDAWGRSLRYVLSNSFAFGGSNASLVFAAQ